MYDILRLLDASYRTIAADMEKWFRPYPAGAAWYVISDYCIGDPNKANDAFSFVIVLNHDTQANIAEYIAAVAPSDIKGSRSASPGLISYLRSPVAFSVSYIVERQSKLLHDYITDDNIIASLPDLRELIGLFTRGSPETVPYYQSVDKRLAAFERDMRRPNRNSGLARQIHLCATFAAMLFKHLDAQKAPGFIRWISDRDAMLDRHDHLTFDLAYIYFQLLRSMAGDVPDRPRLEFGLPLMDGVKEYSELIRLPDYLAGTLADLTLPALEFTHDKFRPVFANVFVNSPNNAVIEVLGSKEKVTTRRMGFSAPTT
ncbi:hypothetical protein ACWGS9_00195 [Bradyrhizobium sp. Arg314]